MKKFTEMLSKKMEVSKSDSDFAFFFSLLVSAEALTKLIVLQMLASLEMDKDRHQYKILHKLVRASGIGDWSKAIDDLLIGTASQHLNIAFRPYQTEFTKKVPPDEWQNVAVHNLLKAMAVFELDNGKAKGKTDFKSWFKLFSEFRNKTRGHGTIPSAKASIAAPYLEKSIVTILENLKLLTLPSAYLKKNLSGKYRVTPISESADEFVELKSSNGFQLEDGVYIYWLIW